MELKVPEEELAVIFENVDLNHDGEINYTEFLAVTVDRRKALAHANLMFAFHHFDVDNSGYITKENLIECFKREGKHMKEDEVNEMLKDVHPEKAGHISQAEFENYMKALIWQ